ncbi:MAG: hypothetical protein QOJ29_3960 [Thermoleophilaceae bacterium]|jgi:hypothetical protein|nr:hypothetical protein [Thermoleophilaceae bacterium]
MHGKELRSRFTLRRRRRGNPALHVHFHQGPQGQPTPCYETRCDRPHLDA